MEGQEDFWALLLKAKAHFELEQYKVCGSLLVEKAYPAKPKEDSEAEKWFASLMHKALMGNNSVNFSGEINKLCVIDSIKKKDEQQEETKEAPKAVVADWNVDPKYDWYQNATHVFISFKIKKGDIRNTLEVSLGQERIDLTNDGEEIANLRLSNFITTAESTYNCTMKKIELKLKKEADGF